MADITVDLQEYLGCLPLEQQLFDLGEGLSVQSQTAGGDVIRSGGAARLWHGSLLLMARRHDDARMVHARIHRLRGSGASFYIGDLKFKPPAGTAIIKRVNADGRLVLQGAPVGRVISPGDYLSWNYAGRRAFHQVVIGSTVKANGETDGIEMVPPIRVGWSVGTAVQLGSPKCRAVLVPGQTSIGSTNRVATDGVTLRWTQTLREYP